MLNVIGKRKILKKKTLKLSLSDLICQAGSLFSAGRRCARCEFREDGLWESGSVDSGLTSCFVKLRGLAARQSVKLACFSLSPPCDFFIKNPQAPKGWHPNPSHSVPDLTRPDQSRPIAHTHTLVRLVGAWLCLGPSVLWNGGLWELLSGRLYRRGPNGRSALDLLQ